MRFGGQLYTCISNVLHIVICYLNIVSMSLIFCAKCDALLVPLQNQTFAWKFMFVPLSQLGQMTMV